MYDDQLIEDFHVKEEARAPLELQQVLMTSEYGVYYIREKSKLQRKRMRN